MRFDAPVFSLSPVVLARGRVGASALARCTAALWLVLGCGAGDATSSPGSSGSGASSAAGEAGDTAGPPTESGGSVQPPTGGFGGASPPAGTGGAVQGQGGSGGAGVGGFGGLDGPSPAEPGYPYDTDVQFEWEETEPPEGPCLSGVYEGTFTCDLEFFPGVVVPITGPVTFTLEKSASGEFLEISDGLLEGSLTEPVVQFSSALGGQLDCSTDTFEAQAIDGTFSDGGLIFGTYSGTLGATLERSSQLLTGEWNLFPSGYPPCAGPWSARRVR